jgi:hypothetical protein
MKESTRAAYRFYKDEQGWFIDLPDWEGELCDLQMVAGADTFLDLLSQGENETYLILSNEPFENCEMLKFEHYGRLESWEFGEGAWYRLKTYQGQPHDLKMWLCDVTKFLFGDLPDKIYFKLLNEEKNR